ncbi:hypothetical protein OV208_39265 [Corallococcus sp. bb12-1]|uniref:hypothetical protein n=1 Tax=Corallococcus sp. bb12-1 TaxID=2996784 RepID=UPI00226F3A8B|nr:hypothetical protein [Corallococcus sp. bb12-1]MCY1047405.1 hypothetical protein [Corallococcus sp. bb12-1]
MGEDLGRILWVPACAAGLAVLLLAVFTLGRMSARARPRWLLAGFGALALGLVLFVPWPRDEPLVRVSPDVLVKAVGGALLVLAAGVSALVVLGDEAMGTGGVLSRGAWKHCAAAGGLSLAAAFMLARTL